MTAGTVRGVPLVLALVIVAYLPFLGGGFLTDDFAHLARIDQAGSARELLAVPDAFGFYRPLTQATLAIDLEIHGRAAAAFRIISLGLHAAVLALAFVVARLVLVSPLAAAAATLAFALTPKAHPIAVLWISARGELLMAVGSLAAIAAWIRWSRGGRHWWIAAAIACYVGAVLSKETALLLPVLLLLTPSPSIPIRNRLAAAAVMAALAGVLLWWRYEVGALMPFSSDPHYNMEVPLARFVGNAQNYVGRMLPAPLAIVAAAVAGWVAAGRPARVSSLEPWLASAAFAVAWVVIFTLPILGIPARNELYLYLPSFGGCMVAAIVLRRLFGDRPLPRAADVSLLVCVLLLAGYQVSRIRAFHENHVFSERLVEALAAAPALRDGNGSIVLLAADPLSGAFLQDAVGGYLDLVIAHARGKGRIPQASGSVLRLRCAYRDGRVLLQPL